MKTTHALLTLICACLLPVAGRAQEAASFNGEVTGNGEFKAWLIEPTTRYGHAILGEAVEAGGFSVSSGGVTLTYRLDSKSVFEDRRVRLADMDGDGRPEAILVKSYLDRGASIAIYKITQTRIVPMAESEPVGKRHRWLNIIGAGDFAGAGETLVAAVVTPHVSGSLRFYRLKGSTLVETGRKNGYSNHIIGSRDIDLARIHDVNGDGAPDILVPTGDRRALAAITFRGGAIAELFNTPLPAKIRAQDPPRPDGVTVTLEDGQRIEIPFAAR